MNYDTKQISIALEELHNSKDVSDAAYSTLKYAIKQLTIPVVGCSFFTASDVGKEFEILANTSGHGFYIGEIVTLAEDNKDPDDDEYKFIGKKDYWFCNFADIKTK